MASYVYGIALATQANVATHATPNTETETFFVKPGTGRCVELQSVYVGGKANALTAISGIGFRVIKWGTASTAGTSFTPNPRDPGSQAAKATGASRPTSGSTRTNHLAFICGAGSPGGWIAPNSNSMIGCESGGAQSISMLDVSATASLNFEWSGEIVE